MPTLDEIEESAAADMERMVAESQQIDWAWKAGRLDEWIDRKVAEQMGAPNVDSSGG